MQRLASNAFIFLNVISFFGSSSIEAKEGSHHYQHWSFLGDFVYMRRTDVHNLSLVKDSRKFQCPNQCPNFTVLDTEDLVHEFDFEPGYRVGATYTPDAKNGIEANFLYLQPWHGEKRRHGHKSLSFPFSHPSYSHDFNNADEAHARYESHFWDAELNYWRYFNPRRIDYFSLSGIAGVRYFHLDEAFKLSMIRPPDKSTYSIHTDNRILGAQLGLDFQMNPIRWLSWEIFAKVGLFTNRTKQKQFLGDLDNSVKLRHSERHKWENGVFTDVAAQVGFQCFKYLNLHAGYQVMFFSGLASAPEQISRKVNRDAGKKDYTHGNAIIHGLFAGAILSF